MHTPGPWSIMKSPQNGEAFVVSGEPVQPFQGHLIAAKTTCPDWEANARLIAAAPELLEACKQVLDLLDKCATITREAIPYNSNAWQKQLRQAIAKAEGRA